MNNYLTIGMLCGQLAISSYVFKSIFNIWTHWLELFLGVLCLFLFFILRFKKMNEKYTYLSSRTSLFFKIVVFGIVLTSSFIIVADSLSSGKIEWEAIFFPAMIILATYLQFGNLCEVYYSEDKIFIDFVLRGWKVPWTDVVSIEKSRFGYKFLVKNRKRFFFQKSLEESPFGGGGSDKVDRFIAQCKAKNIEVSQ